MLTSREGASSRREGLLAGADDFLNKPLDPDELLVCLKTAERILALETRDVALFALAKLAESRDPETGDHVDRVQSYARLLAQNLSPEAKLAHGVDSEYIRLIYQTSPLHDLGKVGMPDAILLKRGKLTPEEFEVMKVHTTLGAQTLDAALQRFPEARFLKMARDIAASHHERVDGTGYPAGLAGEQIPFCGRIVALADVYDALTSRRIYKEAMTHEQAKEIILLDRGKHFDTDVVDAFLKAEEEFIAVCLRLREDITGPLVAEPTIAVDKESDTRACKILVVEDSAITLSKLVELLATTNRPVFAATNAEDAMKIFAREKPGVVLSDWEMPGTSGVEFCRQIRSVAGAELVHFIMLTIHRDHESLLEAYQAGVDDFVGKPFNAEELLARIRAGLRAWQLQAELARRTAGLQALNSQLAVVNTKLDHLSITDELTGLFNRRHAMIRLEEQWALADRYHRPLSLAMIDIDGFKAINDTYGHEAGDVMLRQISTILKTQTRTHDTVCRIGGEEFLIIFGSQTSLDASICAERCRSNVESTNFNFTGQRISATISVGVATRSSDTKDFPDLLRAADRALYDAKNAGRNRVKIAEENIDLPIISTPIKISAPALGNAAQSPVDMAMILDRCAGDTKFTAAVICRFRAQIPVEMNSLQQALSNGDIEVARRTAHNLKSMTAFLSATTASALAGQLEDLARANRLSDTADIMRSFQIELDRVTQWLAESDAVIAMCA